MAKVFVWDIRRGEFKKVLLLSIMMFCCIFVYSLCRDLKDTLVVNKAFCGGAESLGFIKIFFVAPISVLFLLVFIKLSNSYTRNKLFISIVSAFLLFYLLFGFVLYPLNESVHLSKDNIIALQKLFPTLYWFWPVIGNWSFTLFFVMSEMWGVVMLQMLFWQLANSVTTVDEAKRHYSFLGFIGNLGLILSGAAIIFFSKLAKYFQSISPQLDPFMKNIRYQMSSVLICGLILIFTYIRFCKNVDVPQNCTYSSKKKKAPFGILESIKVIFATKSIMFLTIIVISYGVSINLLDFIWMGQAKLLYQDTNDFHGMMGKMSLLTGTTTLLAMIACAYILRKYTWKTAALITPLFLFFSSVLFFAAIVYENKMGIDATICGVSILLVSVILGLFRGVISKSTKYSLFDSTKQMVYIPMQSEIKTKGQAFVELIGGRFGKLGGSAIQTIMLMIVGGGATLSSMIDILGMIVFVFICLWIYAIIALNETNSISN